MATQKQKLEAAKQQAVIEIARAAVVDEAHALELILSPFKADLARLDGLRKTIRGWYADADPAKVFSVYGETAMATVGACGNETIIHDMASVFEAAGKDKFFAACKISLTTLKEIIDPALASAVTGQRQSGPRGLAIMAIRPGK